MLQTLCPITRGLRPRSTVRRQRSPRRSQCQLLSASLHGPRQEHATCLPRRRCSHKPHRIARCQRKSTCLQIRRWPQMYVHNPTRRLHFHMRTKRRRRSFLVFDDGSLHHRFARRCISHRSRSGKRFPRHTNCLHWPFLCQGDMPARQHNTQTHHYDSSWQENSCASAIPLVHVSWIPSRPPALVRMTYAKIAALCKALDQPNRSLHHLPLNALDASIALRVGSRTTRRNYCNLAYSTFACMSTGRFAGVFAGSQNPRAFEATMSLFEYPISYT